MATTTKPAAAADKAAIIAHINAHRTRELSVLLRHYNSLSARQATRPNLRDLSLETMHVRAGGFNHELPFIGGPLSSWDEAVPRIAAMDAVARQSLRLSDLVVTRYAPPRRLADRVVLVLVLFFFACVAALPYIVPGSLPWSLIDKSGFFPGGPDGFRSLVSALFLPVLAIHLVECYFFDRFRLRPHGVQQWTKTWLLWEISCFLEGYTAWKRFGAVVAEEQRQKNDKKQ